MNYYVNDIEFDFDNDEALKVLANLNLEAN